MMDDPSAARQPALQEDEGEGEPRGETADEERKPRRGETADEEREPCRGETADEEREPCRGETADEEREPCRGETADEEREPCRGETADEEREEPRFEAQADEEEEENGAERREREREGENRTAEERDNDRTADEERESRTAEELTSDSQQMAGEALDRRKAWEPGVYYARGHESFHFAGHDISIRESLDSYGALIWPGAVALCQFLENNRQQVNLMDKAVLEIGAGTGLLSIVASLLGAWVTATDLPDILSNLTFNLSRNTKGRCRYAPQATALTWGRDLERDYSPAACRYDYVLAADVVYPHDHLDELLATMRHFLRPGGGTTLLWANKTRFRSDLRFAELFESSFSTALLWEELGGGVRIYRASALEG